MSIKPTLADLKNELATISGWIGKLTKWSIHYSPWPLFGKEIKQRHLRSWDRVARLASPRSRHHHQIARSKPRKSQKVTQSDWLSDQIRPSVIVGTISNTRSQSTGTIRHRHFSLVKPKEPQPAQWSRYISSELWSIVQGSNLAETVGGTHSKKPWTRPTKSMNPQRTSPQRQ